MARFRMPWLIDAFAEHPCAALHTLSTANRNRPTALRSTASCRTLACIRSKAAFRYRCALAHSARSARARL